MIYFECFHELGEAIISEGYVYQDKTNINMSNLYTKLIQEAGRFCDCYASDLIYDIDAIREAIDNHKSRKFYMGFRESGIDHNSFIECRTPSEIRDYRVIWKLTLKFTEDDYYDYKITATLCKVYYSHSEHEFKEVIQ